MTPPRKTKAAKNGKTNGATRIPVIVTTAHRGVFMGYVDPSKVHGETIDLKEARLCVLWSAPMKGFMGLASVGPDASCRIGPPADIQLRSITSVVSVTPEAAAKWAEQPWS